MKWIALWMAAGALYGQEIAGKAQFEAVCAKCHGIDGAGGEHAPSLVETRRRGGSGRNVRDTIQRGIPEAGMPAFPLPATDLDALVAYLGVLKAPAADHPTGGDAEAGKRYFAAQCVACHAAIGPNLSNLGRDRRLAQIVQALRDPGSLTTAGYRPVTVKTKDGRTIVGIARNESSYDLQLLDSAGALHLLSKPQLVSEVREPKSLMPSVVATESEMRDLLAYLTRLGAGASLPKIAPRAAAALPFPAVANPKAGEWPTYHGQLSGNRHSSLQQIDTQNVAKLAPAWMFPVGSARSLEMTPVVVDGVMYVTTANQAWALDARNGRSIWHYSRPLTPGVIGDAASVINRGVAVLGERVFLVTDDAHMLALNRATGQLLWDTQMADYRQHYGATSAPLVVNDLVLSGTSGGDEGARGFLDAYNVATGERAWRFWTMPAPGEPGSETWKGRAIEHGCVTAWLTGTYDPSTNLIYWPTGNPCPDYNGDERQGDNLYSSSVVALDPQTGKLRWYFQFTPHDLHDWDATETPMLVDTKFQGRDRKLLIQANRNGFFYVLDRVTGQFLLGEPFVKKLTWASGIGPDGRPKVLPGSDPTPQGTKVCPAVVGATNWMSTAFNAATGLFYVMAVESCNIYTKSDAWWEQGKSFYGGGTRRVPGEKTEIVLRAIDIQTGKIAWEFPQIGTGDGSWGGVLSTAGGLVFFCDDSGAFGAVDAKTGKSLWHFHTNQSWHASPMTYAVDGKQYVAVAAGSTVISFAIVE